MLCLTKPLALTGVLLSLAACGGTTSAVGGNPVTNPPSDRLTRAEIADYSDDIFQGVRDESATPKALVPLSGSASYAGTMQMDLAVPGVTSDVAGLIEMGVDFRRDRVTGAMGNFVEADGDVIGGRLDLQRGRLDRRVNSREVAIFSDFGGVLRGPGGEVIEVDGDLSGGFAGRNVDYIGADLTGDVFIDGRRGTLDGLTALER